ncbi:hypothetical protein SLS64_010204 [Diaporthe eres]
MTALPAEVSAARDAALEATDELHHLLLGPLGLILSSPGDHYLMLSLQYIWRYKIARHVPTNGEETKFEDIALATGLDQQDVTRFLRVAMGRHVFAEPRKGFVRHTASSRLLIDNPLMESYFVNVAVEFLPSLARTVDATAKWPGSQEPNESGHALANNSNENPFEIIKKEPARQQRFTDAQSFSHMHESFSMDHLLRGYDFSHASSVVDIGGCDGKVAFALAKKYPGINKIVVQDQPHVISGIDIPKELQSRVEGMEHDFFTPQPVKDADVYLMRWVLHDWSDKYCVKILRNLIPALKKNAKVVVNDICIPEPGQTSIAADRAFRKMDISMKAFGNARQRDAEMWAALFTEADEGFRFVGITLPEGARMAIIQAEWLGKP